MYELFPCVIEPFQDFQKDLIVCSHPAFPLSYQISENAVEHESMKIKQEGCQNGGITDLLHDFSGILV